MATAAVDVSEALGFRGPSGFERAMPDAGDVRVERYRFELVCERRPPLAGCWLVSSIMPMREHMMFNGDFAEPWGDDEPRVCKMVIIGSPNQP